MLNTIYINSVKVQSDCVKYQKCKSCTDTKRNVYNFITYNDEYNT